MKMDLDFTNKKVLVTGAGKGTILIICLFICRYLSEFARSVYYEKPLSPSDKNKSRLCDKKSEFSQVAIRTIWDKTFKSGLSKFCGRQPLKNLSA